jgi:uncharacterized protein (TIGR02118 family)
MKKLAEQERCRGAVVPQLTALGTAHTLRCTPREEARMIRVSVMYPSGEAKKFDYDYYVNKHMALVKNRLGGAGLRRLEVDKGVAGGAPGAPAPFACVGHLYFDTVGDFQAAMKPHGKELFADVPNFTNITPEVQISEIIHS